MEAWPRFGLAIFHSRTTRNELTTWGNRKWMVPLYKDNADRIVIVKSSQVGISDFAINSTFAHAMNGQAVMYVLPRDKDVYGFTPRRIDKLINWSQFYRDNCATERKASDTKSQKTLFGTDCHFVGSQSPTNFYEKPCDVLVIDEFDKCDHENLPYAYDRLGSAKREVWYKFGNPTISGFGIDEAFDQSDGKLWLIKCDCGEEQEPRWFGNFIEETDDGFRLLDDHGRMACRSCGKPMDRLSKGRWVAQRESDISGYRVSKLFADPRPNVINNLYQEWLEAQSNPTALQRFYNNVLGETFSAAGANLTPAILSLCACDYIMPAAAEGAVAGVDVGKLLNVQISVNDNGKRRKVFVGTVKDFHELHMLSLRYKVKRGVIDAMPEQRAVAEFLANHMQWYKCFYNLPDTSKHVIEVDHKTRTIRANRTASLDETYASYMEKRVMLPKDWRMLDKGEYLKQMTASTRVYVEHPTDSSKNRYEWQEGNKADHYFHADNYERIAMDMYASGSLVRSV